MQQLSLDHRLSPHTNYSASGQPIDEGETSPPSNTSQTFQFEDRRLMPLTRLKSYVQHLGIFDENWKFVSADMSQPLSALSEAGQERLNKLMNKPIEIASEDGEIKFEISLEELLAFLSQDSVLGIDSIEIFGGMLYYILGKENMEIELNKRGGSLKDVLTDEEIETLFPMAPDLDLCINLKNINADQLKKRIVSFFAKKWISPLDVIAKEEILFRKAFLESKLSDDNSQATVSIGTPGSYATQGKLKVDFFGTNKKPENVLICRRLRMMIHNGKEITIKKLKDCAYTSPLLVPAATNNKLDVGESALMSKLAGIVDTDNYGALEEAPESVAVLMTKGYLVPAAEVRKFASERIVEAFWQDRHSFLKRTHKYCDNHFPNHPFASICYCLNIYSLLESNCSSSETFNQIHALFKSHDSLLHNKNSSDTTSMVAQLAKVMNISMPPKVQIALLRLFGAALACQECDKNEGAMTFSYRYDQLFFDIHHGTENCQIALYGNSYDAMATLRDYIDHDSSTTKKEALDAWKELFFRAYSNVQTKAPTLEKLDERFTDCPYDIASFPPFSLASQLHLLILCRHGQQTHSMNLNTLIALCIHAFMEEGNALKRSELFSQFLQCLWDSTKAAILAPYNNSLAALGTFVASDKYRHEMAWECICHFAGIPLQPFYDAAYALWTKEHATLTKRLSNLHKDRLADSFAPHAPRKALQILQNETERQQKDLLLASLKKIFCHFNNGEELRDEFADLPLLAEVTLQYIPLMTGHKNALPPADLIWLIDTMLNQSPSVALALLEAIHAAKLLPNNCLQQQQLAIYVKLCRTLGNKDAGTWSQLTTLFDKMTLLQEPKESEFWQSNLEQAWQAITQYFNTMLYSLDVGRWKQLETFLRKMLTTQAWHKFYSNSNQRTLLLLAWIDHNNESSLPKPVSNETVLELLLMGCGTRPTDSEATKLASYSLEALKQNAIGNKPFRRPIAMLLQKQQEWLMQTLLLQPKLCLELFDIIAKHSDKHNLPETLRDLHFQVLDNLLDSQPSPEVTDLVTKRLAGSNKKLEKSYSIHERALRLKLITCFLAESNFLMAVEYIKELSHAQLNSNERESLSSYGLQCCNQLFAALHWQQAKELLDHLATHSKIVSDLRLATAWQQLCLGFVSDSKWDTATEILVQYTSLFTEHQLYKNLEATAVLCIEHALQKDQSLARARDGFQLMQTCKTADVSSWNRLMHLLLSHKDTETIKCVLQMILQKWKEKMLTNHSHMELAIFWETVLRGIAKCAPQEILKIADSHQDILRLFDVAGYDKLSASYALILAFLRAVTSNTEGRSQDETLFLYADTVEKAAPQLSDQHKHKIQIAYINAFAASPSTANFAKACGMLVALHQNPTDKKILVPLTQKLMTNAPADLTDNPTLAQDIITLKALHQSLLSPIDLSCFIKPLLAQGTPQCMREVTEIVLQLVKKYHSGSSSKTTNNQDSKNLVHTCANMHLSVELAPSMSDLLLAAPTSLFFSSTDLEQRQITLLDFYLDHATTIASQPGLNRSSCIVDCPITSLATMTDPYNQVEQTDIVSAPTLNDIWVARAQSLYFTLLPKLAKHPDRKSKLQDKAIDLSLKLMFENQNHHFFTQLFALCTSEIKDMVNLALLQQLFCSASNRINKFAEQVEFSIPHLKFIFNANSFEEIIFDQGKQVTSLRTKKKTHTQSTAFYKKSDLIFQDLSQLALKLICYQTTKTDNKEYIWLYSYLFLDVLINSYQGKKDELLHIVRQFAWSTLSDNSEFYKLHALSTNSLFRGTFHQLIKASSLEAAFELHALLSCRVEKNTTESTEDIARREKINSFFKSKLSKKTAAEYTCRIILKLAESTCGFQQQQAMVMMKESQNEIAKELGLDAFMSCYRKLFAFVRADPFEKMREHNNMHFLNTLITDGFRLPNPPVEYTHVIEFLWLAFEQWRYAPYKFNDDMYKIIKLHLNFHIKRNHFYNNSEELCNFIKLLLEVTFVKISNNQFALQDPALLPINNLSRDMTISTNIYVINEVKELIDLVATCNKTLEWYPTFARQLAIFLNEWLINLLGMKIDEISTAAYEALMFIKETGLYTEAQDKQADILQFFREHGLYQIENESGKF